MDCVNHIETNKSVLNKEGIELKKKREKILRQYKNRIRKGFNKNAKEPNTYKLNDLGAFQ